MGIVIDDLELQVKYRSANAGEAIDKLVESLGNLQRKLGQTNVVRLNRQLMALNACLQQIDSASVVRIRSLADALSKLSAVKGGLGFTKRDARGISEIANADMPIRDNALRRAGDAIDIAGSKADDTKRKIEEASQAGQKGFKKQTSTLKTLANATKKVGSAYSALKSAMSKLIGHTKKSEGAFSRLFNALKRIAMYRLLRTIIKEIGQAFREGTQNIAQYSAALNGMDAWKVNKHMSDLATSTLYLKNALGTLAAPILSVAVPALTSLINTVVTAINYINQMIASIRGMSTFTRAKVVAKDYADSLNKAGGAAKELKDALLGIDELNIINGNNGGGGGGAAENFGEMFEEAPVEELSPRDLGKKFADWAKAGLESIDWDKIRKAAREAGAKMADFFNAIWEDKQLAVDMGHSIAEALNTAVDFAEAFADRNKWKEMGEWFGTLTATAIGDFEWGHAGDTIGKFVNGGAKAINGFFKTYKAGSLGDGLSVFVNKMVDQLDSDEIGHAIGNIISAPFKEIRNFLKGTNFVEAGKKISEIFIEAITGENGGETLGQSIGGALAEAINAGADLIIGSDTDGMVNAIEQFFTDIFCEAAEKIRWSDVFEALRKGLNFVGKFSGFMQMPEPLTTEDAIAKSNKLFEEEYAKLEGMHYAHTQRVEAAWDNVSKRIIEEKYGNSLFDSWFGNAETKKAEIDSVAAKITESGGKVKHTTEELTKKVSAGYETAMSASQTATQSMHNDYIKIKSAVDGVSSSVDLLDTHAISLAHDEAEITRKIGTFGDQAVTTSAKVSKSSAEIKKSLDEWFQGTIQKYFSEEQWTTLGDNIASAMGGTVTKVLENWRTQFDTWQASNIENYFGYDKWTSILTEGMMKAYDTQRGIFEKAWVKNTSTWWKTNVEPYFSLETWTTFGTNMEQGVYGGFKVIVGQVGTIINAVLAIFEEAISQIEESMNDLIDDFNDSAEKLGVSKLSKVSHTPLKGVEIPEFAMGGVPKAGQLFIANESGSEYVGSMNGNPAVANNEQIVMGIRGGVREAVTEVVVPYLRQLVDSNNVIADKDVSVKIGDREIARANTRGQRSMGRAIISRA